MLQNLKRGINRELGTPPKQALPITNEILLSIKCHLSPWISADIAFWAACLIGYYGFLRKSTLLSKTLLKPEEKCLLRRDMTMPSNDLAVLYVRHTKTIQFGEKVLKIPFVACKNVELCPLQALKNLFIVCSKNTNDPLFSYRRGTEISWWTHQSFVKKLRLLLAKTGLDENLYSGHSFRRGGATLAFQRGLSITHVKQRGDWLSSAVENYIYVNANQLNDVASVLINGK